MRNLLFIATVAGLAWIGYSRNYDRGEFDAQDTESSPVRLSGEREVTRESRKQQSADYSCDGRVYCSQMHSCDEAIYFLQNCPNTKMDGDHDGVPCETQWCRGP